MKAFLKIAIISALAATLYQVAAAAQSIDANPVSGESNLDFGALQNNETVTRFLDIRASNSTGLQYQVSHEVVQDVANEQGSVLPASAFKFHTVFGSNTYGTLYVLNETPVPQIETLLYNSNAAGSGDLFRISYTVYSSQAQENGNYHGRIRYTFRTDNGAFEFVDEIDVDVSIQAVPELNMVTSSGHGNMSAQFNPLNPQEAAGFIKINFDNNFCHQMKIIQDLETLPANSSGKLFNQGSILFSVSSPNEPASGKPEILIDGIKNLEPKQVPIYQTLSPNGSVTVNFYHNIEGMAVENAGTHQSLVTYLVECDGTIIDGTDVVIVFHVDSVFNLTVTHICNNPPCETSSGEFILGQDMVPGENSQDGFVLKVDSNLPDNYTVTQQVPSPLTHENGLDTVPSSAFTESTEPLSGYLGCAYQPGGTYTFLPPCPIGCTVPIGNEVDLYVSNNPAGRCILATFYLKAPGGIKPGDYYAPFYFTLVVQ